MSATEDYGATRLPGTDAGATLRSRSISEGQQSYIVRRGCRASIRGQDYGHELQGLQSPSARSLRVSIQPSAGCLRVGEHLMKGDRHNASRQRNQNGVQLWDLRCSSMSALEQLKYARSNETSNDLKGGERELQWRGTRIESHTKLAARRIAAQASFCSGVKLTVFGRVAAWALLCCLQALRRPS